MFMTMKAHPARILAPVAVVVAAAAVTFALKSRTSEDPTLIQGSGVIEATETTLSPRIAGRIVELRVQEGDAVRRGQVIARVDTSELEPLGRQAEAGAGAAEARLSAAVAGSRPEQIGQARAMVAQAAAAVAGARAAVANARVALAKSTDLRAAEEAAAARKDAAVAALEQSEQNYRLVRSGARPDQIAQARAAMEQARAGLVKAEADARRLQSLAAQGAVSEQQAEAAVTARDVAQTQVEQAAARLADLQAGARSEELRAAEAAVVQARANLQGADRAVRTTREAYSDRLAARTQYDAARAGLQVALAQERAAGQQLALLVAGTRPEDVAAARHQADQARAQAALVAAQKRNAVIIAPCDGVVTSRVAELGEVVAAGGPVAVIADLRNVWLRVYVPEARYGAVRLGLGAEATVDSYPGVRFQGRVTEIASEAEFTPRNVQTQQERVKLVFGVKVSLGNPDGKLKPGMPADALIRVR